MQTSKLKTIIGSLAVSLMLTAAVHAQMGPMQMGPMTGMPQKGSKSTMQGSGGMMQGGMMGKGGMMQDMMPIHTLLMNHDQISRTVKDTPDGVLTVTTSQDPEIAATIRTHVREMEERLVKNEPIRQGDPLFRQIFLHHNEIALKAHDVPGGIWVMETSKNPQVTLLIQQHAHRAVSEFVKYGMPRAMQPTPLPKGYRPIGGKGENGTMSGGMMGM